MSAILYGLAWRTRLDLSQKVVLLRLVESAQDDGSRIFPSKDRLAADCGLSKRTIQRTLRDFEDSGLIIPVAHVNGGRGHATEYRLSIRQLEGLISAAKASADGAPIAAALRVAASTVNEPNHASEPGEEKDDTMSPFSGKGDTGDVERVTPATQKGDTRCHPNPPEPSIEPSEIERERASAISENREERGAGLAGTLPDAELLAEAIAVHPRSAYDDLWAIEDAWISLSPEERREGVAALPDWVAGFKGRNPLGLPKYLAQRSWTRRRTIVAGPATPKAASTDASRAMIAPWTKPWWWEFWRRIRAGEPVRVMADNAQRNGGYAVTAMATDSELAGLVQVHRDSAAFGAWQAWAAGRNARVPKPAVAEFVWVPAEWPPGPRGVAAEALQEELS